MAPVGLGAGARVIARDSKGYWYIEPSKGYYPLAQTRVFLSRLGEGHALVFLI